MKLGFLTVCLPRVGLEDLVSWASGHGFQALELAAWPVDSQRDYQARQIDAANFTSENAQRVRDLFARENLSISAMAYYENNLHPDLDKRKTYLTHLKKVIDVSEMLGVELVGTFVGGRPDKTPVENIREIGDVFRGVVEYAEDHGVKIMIENCPMDSWVQFGLPGNYFYTPELWDALFTEIESDSFGLNLDPSHLYWLGIDYVSVVNEFASRIFHVHAKDTEILPEGRHRYGIHGKQITPKPWESGWWRYRLPGLGEIDWGRFTRALKDSGYDYVISIEHEDPVWEGSDQKVKEGLLLGREHLSQFLIDDQ